MEVVREAPILIPVTEYPEKFIPGYSYYDSAVRDAVMDAKYNGRLDTIRPFMKLYLERLQTALSSVQLDAVVMVPSSRPLVNYLFQRVSHTLGLPKSCPFRVSRNIQVKYSSNRFAAAFCKFRVWYGCGVPCRVLLVDDVRVTGSTLSAARRCLLSAGAMVVWSTAFAVGGVDEMG